MKARILITGVLVCSLALSGCGSMQDDAFAHAMRSGNARMAVSTIQPGQASLRIYERDGRWYYPIHYSIARGDAEATFGLIRAGSPRVLGGRSLAYNAARVNQTQLAGQLASAGYGRRSEIGEALAMNRREQRQNYENSAMAAAGVLALLGMMGAASAGGVSSSAEDDHMRNHAGVHQAGQDSNGQPYQY
jgi:hypothetical protein